MWENTTRSWHISIHPNLLLCYLVGHEACHLRSHLDTSTSRLGRAPLRLNRIFHRSLRSKFPLIRRLNSDLHIFSENAWIQQLSDSLAASQLKTTTVCAAILERICRKQSRHVLLTNADWKLPWRCRARRMRCAIAFSRTTKTSCDVESKITSLSATLQRL
jgi:hypothetical protein